MEQNVRMEIYAFRSLIQSFSCCSVLSVNGLGTTKPAAQPFNLKPDLVWCKMEYQKFLDNPNSNKLY